jgi:hypothetical protein
MIWITVAFLVIILFGGFAELLVALRDSAGNASFLDG